MSATLVSCYITVGEKRLPLVPQGIAVKDTCLLLCFTVLLLFSQHAAWLHKGLNA